MLLGWLGARSRVLPDSAIPGPNAYVLSFALPCMLFRFGSSLPLDRLADPALLGIYLLCAVAVIAVTVLVTVRRGDDGHGVDLRDAAFGALVAAFPNAGFMGVPLLVALLGDAAAGPVIGAIVIDLVFTSTICLALAEAHARRQGRGGESDVWQWHQDYGTRLNDDRMPAERAMNVAIFLDDVKTGAWAHGIGPTVRSCTAPFTKRLFTGQGCRVVDVAKSRRRSRRQPASGDMSVVDCPIALAVRKPPTNTTRNG